MMNEEKKKVRERNDLNRFLTLLNLENCQIVDDDRECPDFIIKAGNQKIGIEHTQAFQGKIDGKGSHYRKQREIHRSIGEKVVDKISGLVEFTFYLDIHFNIDINFKTPLDISHNITELIKLNIELFKKEKELMIDAFDEHGARLLPEGVENVFLQFNSTLDNSTYLESGAVMAQKFDKNVLDDILQSKEAKLNKYEKFDQNWLLIVANKFFEDGFGEMALYNTPKTLFDKIFLLRSVDNKFITIK